MARGAQRLRHFTQGACPLQDPRTDMRIVSKRTDMIIASNGSTAARQHHEMRGRLNGSTTTSLANTMKC
eukprot:2499088-Lingulodinium_polyedra.AAC.1